MQAGNATHRANVGRQERWLSLGAGALLTLLGLRRRSLLLGSLGGGLLYRGSTGYCPVNARLGRNTSRPGEQDLLPPEQRQIHGGITIERSLDEVYTYWRDLSNIPRFMQHIEAVTVHGSRSHWVARTPWGGELSWDAELTQDLPNDRIAWASLPDAPLGHSGRVRFSPAPDGRGTELDVEITYRPPGGRLGAALGPVFGGLGDIQLAADLHRLKQLLETGEIATIEGQPSGAPAHHH